MEKERITDVLAGLAILLYQQFSLMIPDAPV